MLETLFKSEALLGVLIGATFSFLGLLINTTIEAWKESRRERGARLSEIRNQLGLGKGVQGKDVMLYINSQLPFWLRFFRVAGVLVPHTDLSHTDLTRASLSRQNLSGVNFSFANLTGADLHDAKLRKASFRRAILIT